MPEGADAYTFRFLGGSYQEEELARAKDDELVAREETTTVVMVHKKSTKSDKHSSSKNHSADVSEDPPGKGSEIAAYVPDQPTEVHEGEGQGVVNEDGEFNVVRKGKKKKNAGKKVKVKK